MDEYLEYILDKLKDNIDLNHRQVLCNKGIIHMFYIDNLCNGKLISDTIIAPFIRKENIEADIDFIKKDVIYSSSVGEIKSKDEALIHILSGDVVILFDFICDVIYCEAKGFSKRSITTPITEAVIKGPREGFNEAIVDNISLIRRKIKNPDLKIESLYVGEKSNTIVMIAYLKDVAPETLVKHIKETINNTEIDFVLDVNYIEESIKAKGTFFDTVGYTEKPDIAASKIFEGRVVILVDGSPFALTVPYFFFENFQMADDYYLNKYYTNATRLIRLVAFCLAVLLPGFYIAINSYHFALIPLVFIFRLASSRADVPFPLVLEVFIMAFFFQLLREAGIRLPQPIGQAMSIVGALILGDAAVGSGLASQSTVIVVALSAISSFLIPKLYSGLYLWIFIVTILSSLLGLMGFFASFFMLIAHIASLDSCGYPYFMPFGTSNDFKYKDLFMRKDLKNISKNILYKDDKK
ncbi:spore germination protein [Clostridium sp. A1-XYC3]|uniref:Spore germination protein n=1 Tax=Clostridium tanneri TaxID=3037988 RepID=A0ABU4JV55_9CLOT|nr:spore germination protein [Clostridium sp. A1-XYC3]MDW8802033.1 spore germination protein [Clostridium sp. A1-XYC3]